MAFTRQWLREQIRSHLHDPTLSVAQLDVFIDIAGLRIGQNLRSGANQVNLDFGIGSASESLPADLVEIRALYGDTAGGQYAIQSVPLHRIEKYGVSGGKPQYYGVRGGQITIRPFVAGTYELVYWQNARLQEPDLATNATLEAHPQVYLNAALEAGYQWKQDIEQQVLMQRMWMEDVRQINRQARRNDVGDAPVQRAV